MKSYTTTIFPWDIHAAVCAAQWAVLSTFAKTPMKIRRALARVLIKTAH